MVSQEEDITALQNLSRTASVYLDKLDRYDSQELLSCSAAHWMLSNDVFRMPTEQLQGIIAQMNPKDNTCIMLFPVDETVPQLCYRLVN